MHNPMHTEPTSTATPFSPASDALTVSALQTTREAIARWTGKAAPAAGLARDTARVSPQARWLAETRNGLAAFFENGGFSQFDGDADAVAKLMAPHMYRLDAAPRSATSGAPVNAWMD